MPRRPNPERIKKLEQQAARIDRDLRKARADEKQQARSDRAHVGIVAGLPMIDHALRNPSSEVWRVLVRILESHMALRPKDLLVADTLAKLKALALSEAAE